MKKIICIVLIIILLIALLSVGIWFISRDGSSGSSLTPEPTPIESPTPEQTPSPEPTREQTPTPTPPELIEIDNTPANVYVDIEAGASNPANSLPWVGIEERTRCCCLRYITAVSFKVADLTDDGILEFAWNEILQVEPESMQISREVPYELLSLPRRRIQCRDAARVVANEMLDLLGNSDRALRYIIHDPAKNIWIFSFSPTDPNPSWWVAYAVNGYNSQVIRSWVE